MTADRPATEPLICAACGQTDLPVVEVPLHLRCVEAAQGAAPLTRDDRTNASLPPSAPDEVVRWMRNNDLVAVTRRAYDDVRWGAAPLPQSEWEADDEIAAMPVEGAAPRAEGLDVERLAAILEGDIGTRIYFFGAAYGHPVDESWEKIAADFAAEYASRPSDERVPERQQVVEQIKAGLPGFCVCDIAYTDRQMEAPNCPTHDIERWLSEGFDVRHYPNDNCGNPAHDRILDAWYARAKALVASRRVPESEER